MPGDAKPSSAENIHAATLRSTADYWQQQPPRGFVYVPVCAAVGLQGSVSRKQNEHYRAMCKNICEMRLRSVVGSERCTERGRACSLKSAYNACMFNSTHISTQNLAPGMHPQCTGAFADRGGMRGGTSHGTKPPRAYGQDPGNPTHRAVLAAACPTSFEHPWRCRSWDATCVRWRGTINDDCDVKY